MLPIILYSVTCPAVPYFSTLFHKRNDFWEIVFQHKMCVLIFPTTFVWNNSQSKKRWARYDNECILALILSIHFSCQILVKLEFSRDIFENVWISNFMKIRPVWSRVVPCGQMDRQTDGRTDGRAAGERDKTKLILDFSETWIFSRYFRKMFEYKISWKSVQRGAELFHADRWTDRRTDGRAERETRRS
jgi:hypothetical protein